MAVCRRVLCVFFIFTFCRLLQVMNAPGRVDRQPNDPDHQQPRQRDGQPYPVQLLHGLLQRLMCLALIVVRSNLKVDCLQVLARSAILR